MAKTHGLSGKIGDLRNFLQRHGYTIVSKVPQKSDNPSEKQLKHRQRFQQSVFYGKAAIETPETASLYKAGATGGKTAYNVLNEKIMFYSRINKIKVFSNREGFLGLFDKAEVRIYGYSTGYEGIAPDDTPILTAGYLADLPDDGARRDLLKEFAAAEVNCFAQSVCLEIDGVKDNQSLYFGDAGLVVYQGENIPDTLSMQLWAIESDEDIRSSMKDVDAFLDGTVFNSLLQTASTALTVKNPIVGSAIAAGTIVAGMIRKKLRENRDDLIGYWQATLNRAEHFPHGTRDRQDVPDTTGNMLVDYTLFGF